MVGKNRNGKMTENVEKQKKSLAIKKHQKKNNDEKRER